MGIDESAISYAVHKCGLKPLSLNGKIFNTTPNWYCNDTVIIHFQGRKKIWNDACLQACFPEWMSYYEKCYETAGFTTDFVQKKESVVPQMVYTDYNLRELKQLEFNIPSDCRINFNLSSKLIEFYFTDEVYYAMSIYSVPYKCLCVISKDDKYFDDYFSIAISEFMREDEYCRKNKLKCHFTKSNKLVIEYAVKSIKNLNLQFNEFVANINAFIKQYYYKDPLLRNKCENSDFISCKKYAKITEASDFFNDIIQDEDLVTIICAKDECSKYFKKFVSDTGFDCLTKIPLRRKAFIAVVSGKSLVYCSEIDKPRVFWDYHFEECNLFATVVSEGYNCGTCNSKIIINNIDYSVNRRGLNFVILNKKTGKIIDSINIDTWLNDEFRIFRDATYRYNLS